MLEKNMTLDQVEWLFREVLITEADQQRFWDRLSIQRDILGD